MDFAVRQSDTRGSLVAPAAAHACPQCRQVALVLTRRHVSPPSLGPAVVTEYYDCDCCDARYQFSPAHERWRPIYQ